MARPRAKTLKAWVMFTWLYIDVETTYYFNKNMNTDVDYKINQPGEKNKLALNNDDVVAVGIVCQL